jgi:Protein of unknown function/Domain of unknown function (DUF1835)
MESRINGSYLYFLIDDNLIYCYKIESYTYITLEDIKKTKHSALYKIINRQEFQNFEHENSEAVQGLGLFLDEESLKDIVTCVNKAIKKQQKRKNVKHKKAIHLVTSQYIAGRLAVNLQENVEVIGLDGSFMFGPLRQLDVHNGQKERSEWIYDNINREFEEKNPYITALQNKMNSLDDIDDKRQVYIWYGNNIEEQLALRFFMFIFKKRSNPLYLIDTAEVLKKIAPNEKSMIHTAEIKNELLQSILDHIDSSYMVTTNQREGLATEWQSIANADELLRIWENQAIVSVDLDYFDQTIVEVLKRMSEKEKLDYIKTSQLIWRTIEEEHLYMDPDFLEYRIRHLVYSGLFKMKGIPKNMRRYFVCLQKEE